MAEHLMEKIGKSRTVDLSFNHARGSLNKNKQKKLKQLLNDSQNVAIYNKTIVDKVVVIASMILYVFVSSCALG